VHPTSRRQLLLGAGAAGVLGAVGAGAAALEAWPELRRRFADQGPAGTIPDAPEGLVRLETRDSSTRGRPVGLFTAVPHGHGDGAGLPVCLVLHGGSATTADFRPFGFGRFLTAAVRAGTPPFVLAGVDGGSDGWGGDPLRLLLDELPGWLDERGFETSAPAAWGWSMGGHGVLLLGEAAPERFRALAAFSPAIPSDRAAAVWTGRDRLVPERTGFWCGTSDAFHPRVEAFAASLTGPPAAGRWAAGAHTRRYWDRVTPEAFAFIGNRLAG
jgi:pimeloyl-ACP methyl ester carboxylesterase